MSATVKSFGCTASAGKNGADWHGSDKQPGHVRRWIVRDIDRRRCRIRGLDARRSSIGRGAGRTACNMAWDPTARPCSRPVLTQAARMFASVLISACGTVPIAGREYSPALCRSPATPGSPAFANALAIPVCASGVARLDTCSASCRKPRHRIGRRDGRHLVDGQRSPGKVAGRGTVPQHRHQSRRSINPRARISTQRVQVYLRLPGVQA